MNSRKLKTILLLATLTLLLGVAANAQEVNLHAKVPFDFQVGEKTLTAGEYELVRMSGFNLSIFRIRGENAAMLKVVSPTTARLVNEQNLLVFNKYIGAGGEASYFLTKISVAGHQVGYETGKSHAEKAAAAEAARRDIITLMVERASNTAQ